MKWKYRFWDKLSSLFYLVMIMKLLQIKGKCSRIIKIFKQNRKILIFLKWFIFILITIYFLLNLHCVSPACTSVWVCQIMKLLTAVSCYVGAGHWTLILWRTSLNHRAMSPVAEKSLWEMSMRWTLTWLNSIHT